MSGPICPDCGTNRFQEISFGRLKCTLCQWKGKGLPRKSVSSDKSRKISEKYNSLKKLRDNGEVKFLRIKLRGKEEQREDDIFEIMDILGNASVQGDQDLFIVFNGILENQKIKNIKKLKSVRKMSIH